MIRAPARHRTSSACPSTNSSSTSTISTWNSCLHLHLSQEGFGSKPLHVALTSPKPPRTAKKVFGMMVPFGGAMGQPVFAALPVANGQPGMMQSMGQWPNGAGQPSLLRPLLSCKMPLPSGEPCQPGKLLESMYICWKVVAPFLDRTVTTQAECVRGSSRKLLILLCASSSFAHAPLPLLSSLTQINPRHGC